MTAVTLAPPPGPLFAGVGKTVVTTSVVLLFCCGFVPVATCRQVTGLLVGNHIVDASSLVSLYPSLV